MGLQDLLVTPIYMGLMLLVAFVTRTYITTSKTQGYFIPALVIKFAGAILLGTVYQFYYSGGDTFNYYRWGSRWVWKAFNDDPVLAFKLIFLANPELDPSLFEYTSQMYFLGSGGTDYLARIAGVLGLVSFNTYSSISLFFALFSFYGSWYLFSTLAELYPTKVRPMAFVVFFIPSLILWGSGLLKDTIMLGAVGFVMGAIIRVVTLRDKVLLNAIITVLSLFLIYKIKAYILLCLLPTLIFFVFSSFNSKLKSSSLRILVTPVMLLLLVSGSFFSMRFVSNYSEKYSFERISYTAEKTAWWHDHVSHRGGGAFYSFGDYDYSFSGFARKIIPSLNVTLFRPYFWEVNGPLMWMSALESFGVLLFSLLILWKNGLQFFRRLRADPVALGMIFFALTFAIAIGSVTYNFGALVRYKIPMMHLYLISLIIADQSLFLRWRKQR